MEQGLRVRTKAARPLNSSEHVGGGNDAHGGHEVELDLMEPEEPLSPYSRIFSMASLDTCLIIMFGFATSLDTDMLTGCLKEIALKHPPFCSKLVFDGKREKSPRWVRTKINFEDHFIIPDLDPNMDKPDRFVEDHASDLSKAPMDLSKPLWEFHILNIKISNADDTDTPIKGREGVGHFPKRFVHRLISLDDIMLIKNGTNTTVNDVIVGISDAALSRYLHRKCGGQLQKNVPLRASVIANDLADMMEKGSKCRWGNEVGVFLVPFHVSLEEDALEYVRRANANLNQKKLSLEAALSYYVIWFTLSDLGIKTAAAFTHKVLFNSTLMVSNVLGPAEEITFCGQRLAYIAPTGWGLPLGMVIHFMSYMNKMSIVFGACEDAIPDPHELFDDFVESVELMKNAVLQRKAQWKP